MENWRGIRKTRGFRRSRNVIVTLASLALLASWSYRHSKARVHCFSPGLPLFTLCSLHARSLSSERWNLSVYRSASIGISTQSSSLREAIQNETARSTRIPWITLSRMRFLVSPCYLLVIVALCNLAYARKITWRSPPLANIWHEFALLGRINRALARRYAL
jgi:hypothetical protein